MIMYSSADEHLDSQDVIEIIEAAGFKPIIYRDISGKKYVGIEKYKDGRDIMLKLSNQMMSELSINGNFLEENLKIIYSTLKHSYTDYIEHMYVIYWPHLEWPKDKE